MAETPVLFEGHQPRECGEHRTVGPHRAWCFDCGEWCYPDEDMACKGCRIPMLEAKLDANPEYQSALRDAESESWDGPGIGAEAMIDAATERRRAWRASLRGGSAAREGEPGG
jgi:hypothetical protein